MSASEIAALTTPRIESPSGPPPKKLVVRDLKQGWGSKAAVSNEVTVEFAGADYRGVAGRWHSHDRLGPFRFQLGGYGVMPGWERGVIGMKVGGRRELVIPSKLAGGDGARIYVIDLLGVHRQTKLPIVNGASDGRQDPGKPSPTLPHPPSRRLVLEELRKGDGQLVKIPGKATVKYVGVDYDTDLSFFNAWGPDLPSHISLDDQNSVWARGLAGMKVGGRRQMFIPAQLGYGSGPLVYAFELVSAD